MKEIQLTKDKVAIVDDEDFESLNQYKWYFDSSNGYAARTVDRKNIYMHRQIMNTPKGRYTDHVNRDKLDNRRVNIRICTQSENMQNTLPRKKYKGVWHFKRFNKWTAKIHLNKKSFYIGWFDTEVEAAKAYDQKAKELFGEFAKLNFPTL